MNALTVFAFLTFVEFSYESKCQIPCTKLSSYQNSCGLLRIWTCTFYRTEAHICYKDCVHGGWSEFKQEGECSVTCGGGKKAVTFVRTCDNPPPSDGGKPCEGDLHDMKFISCNTQPCPIQGVWSDYKLHSVENCTRRGIKTTTYKRICMSPKPEIKDFECSGSDTETEQEFCPVDGKWTGWTTEKIFQCSVTCGKGEQDVVFTRSCTNPPPLNGGKNCEGISQNKTVQACFLGMCPIDGGWTDFNVTEVEPCPVTCGKSIQYLLVHRTCTNPIPQHGGKYCKGNAERRQPRDCDLPPCPVDG